MEELKKEYQEYTVSDAEEFKERSADIEWSWAYVGRVWRDISHAIDDETTRSIVNCMSMDYDIHGGYHWSLYELLTKDRFKDKTKVALSGLRKELMERVEQVFDRKKVCYIRFRNDTNHMHKEIMKSCGIIMGEEYIREHKLKLKRPKKNPNDFCDVNVRVYSNNSSRGWGSSVHTDWQSYLLSEVNSNSHKFLMQIPSEKFDSVKENNYKSPFSYLRQRKNLNVATYHEKMEEISKVMFDVGDTSKSFKEIVESVKTTHRMDSTKQICMIQTDALNFTIKELTETDSLPVHDCIDNEVYSKKKRIVWISPTEHEDIDMVYLDGLMKLYCNHEVSVDYKYDYEGGELGHWVLQEYKNPDGDSLVRDYFEATDATQHALLFLRLARKLGDDSPLFKIVREALMNSATVECDKIMFWVDKILSRQVEDNED